MEELRKLEEVQRMLTFVQSRGIPTTSSPDDCSCFLTKLILLLISAAFLDEASKWLNGEGYEEKSVENALQLACSISLSLAHWTIVLKKWLWLDWTQCNEQILPLKILSYFMFHGMDINKPQSVFQYLPVLSFTESYIYQLDRLNEKTLHAPSDEMNMIQDEFKSGEGYWALERKLCYALINKTEISVEDVIKAINQKSFDYRVLNLLLYQLRGEEMGDAGTRPRLAR
ncbi:hypothetical protein Prudu_017202 [Prunus dulcis]|uniref:Uncharacterized protein n=1 Tax=Prunus dulcis TaxID=3755 RepID=A0A4Y1RNQ3_PRUDU|nr:hypothetical protein Prudu_017202 [Prunus dulcis]